MRRIREASGAGSALRQAGSTTGARGNRPIVAFRLVRGNCTAFLNVQESRLPRGGRGGLDRTGCESRSASSPAQHGHLADRGCGAGPALARRAKSRPPARMGHLEPPTLLGRSSISSLPRTAFCAAGRLERFAEAGEQGRSGRRRPGWTAWSVSSRYSSVASFFHGRRTRRSSGPSVRSRRFWLRLRLAADGTW